MFAFRFERWDVLFQIAVTRLSAARSRKKTTSNGFRPAQQLVRILNPGTPTGAGDTYLGAVFW